MDANGTLKILGVRLDRKLNFVAHVSEQVKKACAKASALRRTRRFIPLDVMCRLYKAYDILPHLEYCCPLLLGVGRGQVQKFEVDTNNCILIFYFRVWKAYTIQPFIKYDWYKNARGKKRTPAPSFDLVNVFIKKPQGT